MTDQNGTASGQLADGKVEEGSKWERQSPDGEMHKQECEANSQGLIDQDFKRRAQDIIDAGVEAPKSRQDLEQLHHSYFLLSQQDSSEVAQLALDGITNHPQYHTPQIDRPDVSTSVGDLQHLEYGTAVNWKTLCQALEGELLPSSFKEALGDIKDQVPVNPLDQVHHLHTRYMSSFMYAPMVYRGKGKGLVHLPMNLEDPNAAGFDPWADKAIKLVDKSLYGREDCSSLAYKPALLPLSAKFALEGSQEARKSSSLTNVSDDPYTISLGQISAIDESDSSSAMNGRLFKLHPQESSHATLTSFDQHGLILGKEKWDEKFGARETWMNSLCLLLGQMIMDDEGPFRPFSTTVEISLSRSKPPVDHDRVNDNDIILWNLGFHTTLKISTTLRRLAGNFRDAFRHLDTPMRFHLRRVLHCLLPPPSSNPIEHGNTLTLSDFYALLQPAPTDTPTSIFESMQPPGLAATLRPFQKRTLAWLLGNEESEKGRTRGTVEDPAGFWEPLGRLPFHELAICRLTGDIEFLKDLDHRLTDQEALAQFNSPMGERRVWRKNTFRLDNVRGSMLCEEMGTSAKSDR